MLVVQIYGHVCRVCLGKTSNLLSLNEINDEYSLTMLDLLHQSIPGLEAVTSFPVPQEICAMCRDQLLTAYRFQQMCMTTNEEMYKMWHESQKTEEAMLRRQQQHMPEDDEEEEAEQEIKLIDDVETFKDLDPIQLEYNVGEKKTDRKSEDYTIAQSVIVLEGQSHEPKNDSTRMFMCTLCLKRCKTKDKLEQHKTKCSNVYLDETEVGKEDDEDDKPLISLRNKSNPGKVESSTQNGLINPDDNQSHNKNVTKHVSNTTNNNHCQNCNKSFKYIHHLSKHQCKLITKQLHPCQMCPKQFSSANLVQKHMRNKHKDVFLPLIKQLKLKLPEDMQHKVENSSEINSVNATEFEMDNCHEENCIDLRESDCSISEDNIEDKEENPEICTEKAQSSPTTMSPQSSKKYACTECNASFGFEKQLERHLKKHTDAHRFVCLVCSDRFKYPFMLQKHVEKHHPEGSSDRKVAEVKKGSQEKSHACNYCSAAYTNIGGLAQHMSKKHPEIVPFKCDKCDKTFVVEEHLKIHTNRHMGIKNFKCDLCDKSFSFKFAMKQHMRIHTGDLNYLCTLCGKKFYRPSNLRQHMQRHGDDKPYTCPHCPKRFKCPSDRYIHLMSHQEGKNHVCSTCGARFSRVDTLHQHQILHTGEKPYKCDKCPMAFPRLMNLNRHLRTHTGEKPYKCKYCDKAYAQSNDLNKHLRTHVGENTYMCSQCPSAFKYQADLRNHEWEHYRMQKQKEAHGNRREDEITIDNIEMQEQSVREENK